MSRHEKEFHEGVVYLVQECGWSIDRVARYLGYHQVGEVHRGQWVRSWRFDPTQQKPAAVAV